MYNYLIVGAGLFGSVFAQKMNARGKKCLVIEKRNHIAGNIYSEEIENALYFFLHSQNNCCDWIVENYNVFKSE